MLAGARSAGAGSRYLESVVEKWRHSTKRIRAEVYVLYLAYRDPRVPWYARAFAALVVAYAFSPIDLIPDFIPVLGYLDDLILIPAGVILALRMIPADVMKDARAHASHAMSAEHPTNKLAAIVVILIWLSVAAIGIKIGVGLISTS